MLYSVNYNKLHVSAGNGHHQVSSSSKTLLGGATQFVKRRIDEEISSSVFRYLLVVLWYWVDLSGNVKNGGGIVQYSV